MLAASNFVGTPRSALGMIHGVSTRPWKDTVVTVAQPEVRAAAGALRGRLESDVVVFQGIPFAEPPARFAAPQPVEAWDGTRDAVSYGPPPPQSGLLGVDALAESAEGWLTVNVWTPDPGANLPVMVWIQGGGYLFGTSGRPEYDGGTAGAGRRSRRGHVQLPRRHRGFRPDRRSAREPRPARPGRRAGVGAGQHRRVRRRPRTRSRCSASRRARDRWPRCWRCHGRPACSAGRSRRACRARSSRPSWPPTSPAFSRPNWA